MDAFGESCFSGGSLQHASDSVTSENSVPIATPKAYPKRRIRIAVARMIDQPLLDQRGGPDDANSPHSGLARHHKLRAVLVELDVAKSQLAKFTDSAPALEKRQD